MQDDGTSHGPIDDRFVPEGLEELAFEVLGARQRGEPPAAIAQALMEEHRLGAMNAYKLLRSIGLADEAAQSAINEATRPAGDA